MNVHLFCRGYWSIQLDICLCGFYLTLRHYVPQNSIFVKPNFALGAYKIMLLFSWKRAKNCQPYYCLPYLTTPINISVMPTLYIPDGSCDTPSHDNRSSNIVCADRFINRITVARNSALSAQFGLRLSSNAVVSFAYSTELRHFICAGI